MPRLINSQLLSRSGAYLLPIAKKLAAGLLLLNARFLTKRAVIDGYLLEGKRVGNQGFARVIDLPAFLLQPRCGSVLVDDSTVVIEGPTFLGGSTRDRVTAPRTNFVTNAVSAEEVPVSGDAGDVLVRKVDYSDLTVTACGPALDEAQFAQIYARVMPANHGELPAAMHFWMGVSGKQRHHPQFSPIPPPGVDEEDYDPGEWVDFWPMTLLPYGREDEALFTQKAVFVGILPALADAAPRKNLAVSIHSDWLATQIPEGYVLFRAIENGAFSFTGGTEEGVFWEVRDASPPEERRFWTWTTFVQDVTMVCPHGMGHREDKLLPLRVFRDAETGDWVCRWLLVTDVYKQNDTHYHLATNPDPDYELGYQDYFGRNAVFFIEIEVRWNGEASSFSVIASDLWDPIDSEDTDRHPGFQEVNLTAGTGEDDELDETIVHWPNGTDFMPAALCPAGVAYLIHTQVVYRETPSSEDPEVMVPAFPRYQTVFRWSTDTGLVVQELPNTSPFINQDFRAGRIMNGCPVKNDTVVFVHDGGLAPVDPNAFDPFSGVSVLPELDLYWAETEFSIPVVRNCAVFLLSPAATERREYEAPGFYGYGASHFRAAHTAGCLHLGGGKIGFLASTAYTFPTGVAAALTDAVLVTYDITTELFEVSSEVLPQPPAFVTAEFRRQAHGGVPAYLSSQGLLASTGPNSVRFGFWGTLHDTLTSGGAYVRFAGIGAGVREDTWQPFTPTTGVITAGEGYIAYSTDGGETWKILPDNIGSPDGVYLAGNALYSVPAPDLLPSE